MGSYGYRFSMNLEDHPGDIIRKAWAMAAFPPPPRPTAAGISEAELSALEETGQSGKRPDFKALANLIGLNPAKLEASRTAGCRPEKI